MSLEFKLRWIVLALAFPLAAHGQKDPPPIQLTNPSFEDLAKGGQTPVGWYNCGNAAESPPDIQPGSFSVTKAASNGSTYLGLVVRDNETNEAVGQRLSRPLEINQCYEMNIDLCRAEIYESLSRLTGDPVNYATPAKIRIWGGNGYCDKAELLFETPIITNTRWVTTNCRFHPKKGNYSFIIIEAYYKQPVLFPYNGNILLDNTTAIRQLPCNPEKMPPPIAKKTPTDTTKKIVVKSPPAPPTPAAVPEPKPMDRKNLKAGSIIRLDNVYFEMNKYDLKPESMNGLQAIFNFLKENPDVMVEIGGHTNNNPSDQFANDLSTNRAKSVADWLTSQGISPERVTFKGYGKKMPIAQNTTPEGRKKNQRVEIKILSING